MSSTGETYKPSEHDGLKEDGTPDKRMSSSHGFGGKDGPDPHVEGRKGGKAREGVETVSMRRHVRWFKTLIFLSSQYKPSEHDGLKEDGTPDKRTSSEHGFGADRERASELGRQGGSK